MCGGALSPCRIAATPPSSSLADSERDCNHRRVISLCSSSRFLPPKIAPRSPLEDCRDTAAPSQRFPSSEFRLPLQFGTLSFPILPFIGCPGPAKRRLEFLPAPRGSAHARALRVHRFSLLARAPRGSQPRKVAPPLRQEGRPDVARALSRLPRCIGKDRRTRLGRRHVGSTAAERARGPTILISCQQMAECRRVVTVPAARSEKQLTFASLLERDGDFLDVVLHSRCDP